MKIDKFLRGEEEMLEEYNYTDPKKYEGINVLEASKLRINKIFDNYKPEQIWVSISLGKDSAVVLYLMREVALERGIETLNAVCFRSDMRSNFDFDFLIYLKSLEWLNFVDIVAPFQELKFDGNSYPAYWHDNRQIPEDFVEGMTFFDYTKIWQEKKSNEVGKCVMVLGIRTDESLNRFRAIKKTGGTTLKKRNVIFTYPIYDWAIDDIWLYYKQTGAIYNAFYDVAQNYNKSNRQTLRIDDHFYGQEQRALIYKHIDALFFVKIEMYLGKIKCEDNYRLKRTRYSKIYENKHFCRRDKYSEAWIIKHEEK